MPKEVLNAIGVALVGGLIIAAFVGGFMVAKHETAPELARLEQDLAGARATGRAIFDGINSIGAGIGDAAQEAAGIADRGRRLEILQRAIVEQVGELRNIIDQYAEYFGD